MKRGITENLLIDTEARVWQCSHCGYTLGPASAPYKHGCLVAERSPHEIWPPVIDGPVNFSYHPDWCRIVEFYCPACAWLIEIEVLPPGHPITSDIELDLEALDARTAAERAQEP